MFYTARTLGGILTVFMFLGEGMVTILFVYVYANACIDPAWCYIRAQKQFQ